MSSEVETGALSDEDLNLFIYEERKAEEEGADHINADGNAVILNETKKTINDLFRRNPFLKIAKERSDEDGFSLSAEEMKTAHAKKLLDQIVEEGGEEFSPEIPTVVGYTRNQLWTLDEFAIFTETNIQIAQWFLDEGALAFAEIGDAKEREIKDVDAFLVLVATRVAKKHYAEKSITKKERTTNSLSGHAPALFEEKTITLSPKTQLYNDLQENNFLLLKRLKTIMNTLLNEFFVEHELEARINRTGAEEDEDEDLDEMYIDFEILDIQELIKARVDKDKLKDRLKSFRTKRNQGPKYNQTINFLSFRRILDTDAGGEMLLFLLQEGLITEYIVRGSVEVDEDALEQYNALIKKSKSERGRTNFIAKTSLEEDDFCHEAMNIFERERFGMTSWERVKENFDSILGKGKNFTLKQLRDGVSGFVGKILLLYLYDAGLIDRYDARTKSKKEESFKGDILEEKTSDFYKYHFIVTKEGETKLLQSAHDFLQSKGLLLDETSE